MSQWRAIVVSHTHWDREWYLPFQEFRVKLVGVIDELLTILQENRDYRYFTLDGQAIILEDYVEVRPEREETLRHWIQQGRLLTGPWYVLPDEFLVSPESLVRNLMMGHRVAGRFGPVMKVGYTPDPFGHIGQLPQILRGFDIDAAIFRRGLSDEPTELRWLSPDGSEVLVVYLREGYDNAAHVPTGEREFVEAVPELKKIMAPHTSTSNLLFMNGTDHMAPFPELPRLMASANERLDDLELVHGTLPMYVEAVRDELGEDGYNDLATVRGELRSPKRHHLLPGVLSTRIWIKQRNNRCEVALEKWAEPFNAWAWLLGGEDRSALIWQAWRYLFQNQFHDSICGTSVDQVHGEMAGRFDWVEQITGQVTEASLQSLARQVEIGSEGPRVVVFNPHVGPRTDLVSVKLALPDKSADVTLVDAEGEEVPCRVRDLGHRELTSFELGRWRMRGLMKMAQSGLVMGRAIRDVAVKVEDDIAYVDAIVSSVGQTDPDVLQRGGEALQQALDAGIERFRVKARSTTEVELEFLARDVPTHGYKAYSVEGRGRVRSQEVGRVGVVRAIENEFYRIQAGPTDGTLTVTDKETEAAFRGVNRFVDGGDRGDQYNYCPPAHDVTVDRAISPPSINLVEDDPIRQTLQIRMVYRLPVSLSEDRASRSGRTVELPITTRVSLCPGVRRIDISTTLVNKAHDHRLRVHFPTRIRAETASAEGQFDVVERRLGVAGDTAAWIEQPVPTHPQRTFVSVGDGEVGLLLANRGLPEYEVISEEGGVTIALTLLRAVGWLSRGDLPCRKGHAGPRLETPEAQCPGEYTFEYALVPHAGDWRDAFQEAHAFNAPLRGTAVEGGGGMLGAEGAFLEAEPDTLVVSTVKTAEMGEGLIVRCYNIDDEPVEGRLRFFRPFASASRVNLNEELMADLSVSGSDELPIELGGREIATYRLRF